MLIAGQAKTVWQVVCVIIAEGIYRVTDVILDRSRARIMTRNGRLLIGIIALASVGLLFNRIGWGQSQFPPLSRSHFLQAVPQGFGDRQNSYAWSMEWFEGKLFVGTGRAVFCAQAEAYHLVQPAAPYPPPDLDIQCTPDPNDLPLQAEIWSWDPATNIWARVYQSPNNVPIRNTNPQKFTARDFAFRGMGVFTEPDGTPALYVSGCSPGLYPGVPPARVLRTTDGVNFTALPQTPGTFLGNFKGSCYRGIQAYNNKLYLMSITPPVMLESADPQLGDNSFRAVTRPGSSPWEMAAYNGYLYVSFADITNGFSVSKTNAQGTPPYAFTPLITNGGFRSPYPNKAILSMAEFNGSLYLGGDGLRTGSPVTAQPAEMFRINADDSWDLVVGQSRSTPAGQKNSLSGLGPGFNWNLNAHMWRMEVFDGRLYVGTFDESTIFRSLPQVGPALQPEFGFDLWYTSDGVHFLPIDYQGFEDKFNIGARSLKATPVGLFLGTANPYYGLQIWQGIH